MKLLILHRFMKVDFWLALRASRPGTPCPSQKSDDVHRLPLVSDATLLALGMPVLLHLADRDSHYSLSDRRLADYELTYQDWPA